MEVQTLDGVSIGSESFLIRRAPEELVPVVPELSSFVAYELGGGEVYATFRPRDVRGDLIGSGLVPVLVLGDGEGCTPLEYCGIGKYCWTGQGFSGDFAVRVGMDGEWVSEPVELFQVGGDNSVPLDNGMECSPFLAGAEEGEEPDTATEDTTGENEGPDAADGESSGRTHLAMTAPPEPRGIPGYPGKRTESIRRILPTERERTRKMEATSPLRRETGNLSIRESRLPRKWIPTVRKPVLKRNFLLQRKNREMQEPSSRRRPSLETWRPMGSPRSRWKRLSRRPTGAAARRFQSVGIRPFCSGSVSFSGLEGVVPAIGCDGRFLFSAGGSLAQSSERTPIPLCSRTASIRSPFGSKQVDQAFFHRSRRVDLALVPPYWLER